MKEAIGYITEDGKFFEGIDEAEEHEAFVALQLALVDVGGVNISAMLKVIVTIPNEIRRYINANEAATRYREIQASLSAKDNTRGEADTQVLFEQQTRIDEPLPNMGSSVEQKEVQLERAIDGIRSRGTDASDVRSSEDLAIRTHTKPTKARLNSSTSNIRQGKME